MDIVGRIIQILPEETGEGKNGTWKKRAFVIETQENYPKKICFVAWGDKVDWNGTAQNDVVKVFFDAESREWSGKWYTDLKVWKIEKEGAGQSYSTGSSQDQFVDKEPVFTNSGDATPTFEDDLPF